MCIESKNMVSETRFRSLDELSKDFQTQAGLGPKFRSLKDLHQDFQQRQVVAEPVVQDSEPQKVPARLGSFAGTLVKLFEGKGFGFVSPDDKSGDVFLHFKDILNGSSEDMIVGMRVAFDKDIDRASGKKRAKNAVIVGMASSEVLRSCLPPATASVTASATPAVAATATTTVMGTLTATPTANASGPAGSRIAGRSWVQLVLSPSSCRSGNAKPANGDGAACYSRSLLLALREVSTNEAAADCSDRTGVRTVYMPRTTTKARKANGAQFYEQDPNLDDEDCLVKMEARLSRESGADAKNDETFGECAGGWTFDQAVEANSKLSFCRFSLKVDVDTSTATSDGVSSEHGSSSWTGEEPAKEPLSPLSFMLSHGLCH